MSLRRILTAGSILSVLSFSGSPVRADDAGKAAVMTAASASLSAASAVGTYHSVRSAQLMAKEKGTQILLDRTGQAFLAPLTPAEVTALGRQVAPGDTIRIVTSTHGKLSPEMTPAEATHAIETREGTQVAKVTRVVGPGAEASAKRAQKLLKGGTVLLSLATLLTGYLAEMEFLSTLWFLEKRASDRGEKPQTSDHRGISMVNRTAAAAR